ncbi:uncharacterized protein BDV17DRAFT_296794 [Aspergillus undulatus]|uniref:uncharacterized protein n=1 Tax=Aspergillus undulatus TaxID=1810928 RepID=UPI003CCD5652
MKKSKKSKKVSALRPEAMDEEPAPAEEPAEELAEPIEIEYNQPITSPYKHPIAMVVIGTKRYGIPMYYLENIPQIKRRLWNPGPQAVLDNINEDIGHILIHFLYTGQYETLDSGYNLVMEYQRNYLKEYLASSFNKDKESFHEELNTIIGQEYPDRTILQLGVDILFGHISELEEITERVAEPAPAVEAEPEAELELELDPELFAEPLSKPEALPEALPEPLSDHESGLEAGAEPEYRSYGPLRSPVKNPEGPKDLDLTLNSLDQRKDKKKKKKKKGTLTVMEVDQPPVNPVD